MSVTGEPNPSLPSEESGVELQRVQPRLFGTIPPLGLLSAGGLSALVAIALLVTGHWVIGPLLLVLGLLALGLYLVAAHHRPHSRLAQRAVGGVWLARDELRFAGTSAGAWSRASIRILRLRRDLHVLAREREGVQHELGAAAYHDDAERVAEHRARMRELDERMASCARRMEAARRVARARVSRARVPLRSTEIIRPDR
jgi:hypothetical protein